MVRTSANNSIREVLAARRLDSDRDLWMRRLREVTSEAVEAALASRPGSYDLMKLLALISPAAEAYLEQMAELSQRLTTQRFGRTIKLYVPLYLSSYCVNRCRYCTTNLKHR